MEENLEKHVCFQQICVRCVFSPNIPHYFSEIQYESKKSIKKTLDLVLGCKEHLRFAKICSERKKERKGDNNIINSDYQLYR